jgi:hypothetical protein
MYMRDEDTAHLWLHSLRQRLKIEEIRKNMTESQERPFNLQGGGYGFLFRSEFFFRTTQELEY